jgi:membrane-associated phospholipid phosphatase
MTLAQPVDRDAAEGPGFRRVRAPMVWAERLDDAAAMVALRSRRVPGWDRVMYLASACGDDGRIWIAAAAFESARVRSPRRFAVLVGALAAESVVVNLGIKKVARRPRPAGVTEHEFWLRIPTDTSFPSGHAASSALMAVLLSERSPFAPLWVALAATIGASRVHVGVHHGSDVLAGWVVGAAMAAALRSTGVTRPG